jgi:DnaJ-class molecular chaperone
VAAVERLLSPQITPPGTQPGAVLRVGGKGLPRVKGKGRGDLYMSIAVRIPEHVNEQERRLYEQLRGGAVPPVGGSG